MQNRLSRPRRQRGFTLIEILVAVIVLSVGLLGVASLQIASKRGNFEAMQRSAATMYAESLVERMRANPVNYASFTNGDFVTTSVGVNFASSDYFTSQPGTITCNSAVGCAHAQADIDAWWAEIEGSSVEGGLLAPSGCVLQEGGYVTVAIAWRGLGELADPGVNPITISECGQNYTLYEGSSSGRSYRRRITLQAYIYQPPS